MPGPPMVVVESPYRAAEKWAQQRNLAYARAAVRDCLLRGEAPFASHLLYTQQGVLRDEVAQERGLGIGMGWEIGRRADLVLLYVDLGISQGMHEAEVFYWTIGKPIVRRRLPGHMMETVRLLTLRERRAGLRGRR